MIEPGILLDPVDRGELGIEKKAEVGEVQLGEIVKVLCACGKWDGRHELVLHQKADFDEGVCA